MNLPKAFKCLTKIALPCVLALVPLSAQATISNVQAKAIIHKIVQDYREELLAHPMPFRTHFDENRKKPSGMFAFFEVGKSAHIDVENRVLSPGTAPVATNIMKTSGYFPSLPGFTTDVFAMVICHEIGHIVGGAPMTHMMPNFPEAAHSIEGQADYFATAKCFKRYAQNNPLRDFRPRTETWSICKDHFSSKAEALLCARAIKASEDLVNALRSDHEPVFKFKSELMIDREPAPEAMLESHPDLTCRLRTLVAGALCSVSPKTPVSFEDPQAGYCENSSLAGRPRCWYTP
jgi:hypothetical protein